MKRLNHLIVLTLLILISAPLTAQDTIRFTLQQAIDYALQHSVDIQTAELDVVKARRDVKVTTASGLPQVNGSVRYTNYPAIPVQVVPAEFFGGQPGQFIDVRFGVENNMRAAIDVNQMIFDGRFFQGLKAATAFVDLTQKQLDRSKVEAKNQVAKAYYAAQVAQKNVQILKDNLNTVNDLYRETKALFDNGFIESIEVDRVQLTKTNIESQLESAERQVKLSLALLKFQMGMDIQQPFALSETLDDMQLAEESLLTAAIDPSARSDYKVLLLQEELGEINTKNIRAGYFPSLYFFGTIETQAFREEFNFYNSGQWFGAGFLGVTLNVPLWDSGEKAGRIQKQQAELRQLDIQQERLRNAISLELMQAQNNYQDALERMNDQKDNLQLAEKIYNVAVTKYNEGVGSSLEVNNAQTTLYQTQSNYINTLYQVMVAKADLEKALER